MCFRVSRCGVVWCGVVSENDEMKLENQLTFQFKALVLDFVREFHQNINYLRQFSIQGDVTNTTFFQFNSSGVSNAFV